MHNVYKNNRRGGEKRKEGKRGTKGRDANLLKSYFLTMCYKATLYSSSRCNPPFWKYSLVIIVSQRWSMVGMNLNNSSVPPFRSSWTGTQWKINLAIDISHIKLYSSFCFTFLNLYKKRVLMTEYHCLPTMLKVNENSLKLNWNDVTHLAWNYSFF